MDIDEIEITDMDCESSPVENDEHWFCFDDTLVTCVTRQHIQRHYGLNDCAYMLFYRLKSKNQSQMDCSNSKKKIYYFKKIILYKLVLDTLHSIPQWLLDEISEKNRVLDEKR
jgi:hypothetical protein